MDELKYFATQEQKGADFHKFEYSLRVCTQIIIKTSLHLQSTYLPTFCLNIPLLTVS